MDNYRSNPALNASSLKELRKSPAHFWSAYYGQGGKATPSMEFGTAVHCYFLEFDKFHDLYEVVDKRSTKYSGEKIQLKQDGIQSMEVLRNIKLNLPREVLELFTDPAREVEKEIYFTCQEIGCKAKIDLIVGDTVYDLKTTRNASPDAFARTIVNEGYDIQMAHYLLATGLKNYAFIAMETQAPYLTMLYHITAEDIIESMKSHAALMEEYKKMLAVSGKTSRQGYGGINERVIKLPKCFKEEVSEFSEDESGEVSDFIF